MKKKIALLLAFVLMVGTLVQPAYASNNLSDLKKQQQAVANEIKKIQSQLRTTQQEMALVEMEIMELDEQLSQCAEDLETISQALAETEALLLQSEAELEQARTGRDEQFDIFKTRLRVMYEYGSVSFVEVLFKATSIRDFLTRLDYVTNIAKYDQQLVDKMKEAEDQVSGKVEEIARQRNTVEVLQFTQEQKLEELQVSLEKRNAYFDQLDENESRYQAKLEQDKKTENAVKAAIQKAQAEEEARLRAAKKSAVTYNGVMKWPAPSYTKITDTYRNRTNPVNKKAEFHTGVDIAAPMGSDILAADAGEVILASYNGGYGYCVIISHGGGVSTLYGHASKLLVSKGQTVKKGQAIAKIGSTGNSTGPHLHFEVRINGAHTNPKPYLGY